MCQPQIPPPPALPAGPTVHQVIIQLREDPIKTMKDYAIETHTTEDQPPHRCWLYFKVNTNNHIIDIVDSPQPDWILKQGYVSPMQSPGSPHRTTALEPLQPLPYECFFWVTDIQTGCSVLILDWGGNNITMTHLQPHKDETFSRFSQKVIFSIDYFRRLYKNMWLRFNLAESTENTSLRYRSVPRRYILIQSEFSEWNLNTQVIGIKRHNAPITFYMQQYARYTMPPENITVRKLEWSTYHEYLPYIGY